MEKIVKTLKYNNLLSIYKELLSTTQREVLESYFCYDLSLSEIASERNVSRAAIEDALQKGCQKLEEYESLLHHNEKKEEILKNLAKLKENCVDIQQKQLIEEIERRL